MRLTKPQKLIYDMEKYAGQSIALICGSMLLKDSIEEGVLVNAVHELYRLNDALRMCLSEEDGEVSQYVCEYTEPSVDILRFADKRELDSYAAEYAKQPLDISCSLCDMKIIILNNGCGLLVKLHHLIGDAWTLSLIGTQLISILQGNTPEVYSYTNYVDSEAEYLQSKRYAKDRDFFIEQFKKCDEATYLCEKQSESLAAERKTFVIEAERAKQITEYAEQSESSVFMLFMTVLATYINRTKMNAEKFYIGTAVLNRAGIREQNTMGMFINTVPMLIELDNNASFAENMFGIKNTTLSVFRHQKYNYGDVLQDIRREFSFTEKLYDVILSYQNATIGGNCEAETTWYHSGMQSESLQIHIDDRDGEGIFRIHFDYQTEKFTEYEIERMYEHIINLLFDAVADDSRKLYELEILSADEKQRLLVEFNDTAIEYPREKCVHELFEEQVKKTPDKTALVACDKTYTYSELNEEANRIAHSLIEKGICVGDIVAIALPRKGCLIASMLGILKAGAAYLPIDPEYPQDRIDYMMQDSGAKLLITEADAEQLANNPNKTNPSVKMSSDNLCYVIFTSGSTGKPKASCVMHRNLGNFTDNNNNNKYQCAMLNTCSTVLAVGTIVFDISVFEIFLSLVNGLEVVMSSDSENVSASSIAELIEKYDVDVIHSTPSKISLFLEDEHFQRAAKHLKMMMVGAEVFTPELLERIEKYTDAIVFNGYGPSETTIGVSFQQLNHNDNCIYRLFDEQVAEQPEMLAIKDKHQDYSYSELGTAVDEYCSKLQSLGIKKGDVVAIHLNRSCDLIIFQLAVIKAGAIFLPVDKRYPLERIEYMCSDCNIALFISDELTGLSATPLITLAKFKEIKTTHSAIPVVNDTCYIIYTSGSTGKPKGCVLKTSGIINFCKNNNTLEHLSKIPNNIFASVNSVSFDYFIAESLLPLLNGYSVVIFDDDESVNQSLFLRALKENKVNVLMTTPTKLKIYFGDSLETNILSQISCVCTSGEALQTELLELIYGKAPNAQVFNPLGPSECTVWNVGGELDKKKGIDITIGKPIANTQIYIVDKFMQPTPIGITGELCIAGAGVGAGYLNRPELTAEKFIDNPFGDGKLYKTGDLAYWREDGNIVYVGRNDFQVKIRGLRIELGEIENAISGYDGISQAVVVVRKNNEGRQLICAFYTGKESDAKSIREEIGKKLPKYMLPHIFTHLDEMPLTASGKINRKALPEVDLYSIDTTTEYVAPQTEQEIALVNAIEAVLGIEKVGILDNFFDLGGDSLKAIELISKLQKFGFSTDTKTVFACNTVKELAEHLTAAEQRTETIVFEGDIPATAAQMRVYTSQSMNANSTTYNVPYAFKTNELDPERLQNAVTELIKRHEILRTRFENKDGSIIQVIEADASCVVEACESDDIGAFIRPFDLSQAPLIRVGYCGSTVMLDMHHIITDGGSMPVFLRELNELYMGRELTDEPVQYSQFALSQSTNPESENYWLSVYSDEPPVLEINTDFKRGHHQTFNGNAVYTSISNELHGRILTKCKALNITPYVFYMSGFNILLSKFSGGEDITVGMPVSGRDGRYLDTIGMFVNTVVLRSKPVGEKTAAEFMAEVKADSIDAIEHQDYPYGELIKKLNISSGDRNPLFDVMFAYQSEEMTEIVFGDSKAEILPVPITTSKYDFTFNLMPRENGAVLMAEYCTDLFKESTIQRFIAGYKLILEQMLDEHILLKDICAVSEQEMQTLLFDFNDTAVEYPRDKCVHELFEEQVAKTPDKTAVIACDKQYTYAELNEEANRIAHSLIAMGINVGDIIAIALPRKSCLIAAMLGVLKVGAAYLPIDPDYPQDRISYMIEESSAKLLITEDKMDALNKNENNSNPCLDMSSENLCYVIFTSGSTGKPKGTAVMHRNLGNFTSNNEQNSYQYTMLKNCKTVLAITTFIFDISVFEIFLSLVNGLEIVMSSDEENVSASALAELIEKHNVDAIHSTPSKITMFIEDEHFQRAMKQLKIMMVGAEVFAPELLERIEKYTDAVIFNGYGPTETTIGSSFKQLTNRSVCVHELFEEQAASAPDNTAVIACDASLTYAELNEQANSIAHSLIDKGVCGGDIVAFVLHRRSYLVAAMFGILKSGAAYLPIDPDYPQDRISYMIEDSKAKFVITDDNIIELLSHTRKGNPSISVKPDSLFCALHTSGSTGTPKMSLLKHSGMMSFIAANKRFWKGTDTVVSATIVTFDAFVMDSVLSVSQGVKLVLASEDDIYNQANFERLFDHSENNMFFSTPTKLESYITNSSDKAYLRRIKSFVVGGEVFGEVLLSHISEHTPESRVYNIYGPTETTICAVVDCLDRQNDITIGKPIANTQIYIVDKHMRPTPIGVTGELCIAGDGVGAGYLNRPELTAEKFIDNPFGEGKLYKTGDLAYWREDGNIVYIGRNDFQVKIRGLRIELGEIENAIDEIDGISHAVVVVRKNNEGRQLICAFCTGADVEVKTIREHISQKLPKYMMPHIFTHLDDMPLTPSGKVNRKALPEVDLYNIDTSAEYEAPTTDMQKALCRLMEQVLGTSPIGISDDFFELGGDSLKAIEFVSKAHNEGIYFTLQNVFDYPIVRSLDECIRNGDSQEISFADVDFSEVDKLLVKNKPEFITEPIKSDVGNLLIAGATGYLGIHILADFLNNDSGTAYCLVRGKDAADSKKRLTDLLVFYFGDKYAGMLGNRIVVLNADLQKDLFGMSQDDYSQLASQINTVVNAAASVKHYGSYKYFYEANVETAKRVIEFCRAADAKLIHTSTMSISGNSFADTFDGYVSESEKHFYESSLYIGQPLDNVYARSKFEAEKAVLDAMADGLKANIMRMGNLTNRLSDGMFQKNHESNAFLQRVSSVLQLGVFPDYLMKLYAEFTPIDEAASAVMTIARHFSTEQTVFHINSINVVYMDKLLEYFNSLGFGLKIVSGAEFTEALRQTAKQTGMEHIFETFINDMDENDQLNYDSNIRIENEFTVQYLKSLGFEWADIGYEYICKYIAYFRKIGFLGA